MKNYVLLTKYEMIKQLFNQVKDRSKFFKIKYLKRLNDKSYEELQKEYNKYVDKNSNP